jgi:hypothetical protein
MNKLSSPFYVLVFILFAMTMCSPEKKPMMESDKLDVIEIKAVPQIKKVKPTQTVFLKEVDNFTEQLTEENCQNHRSLEWEDLCHSARREMTTLTQPGFTGDISCLMKKSELDKNGILSCDIYKLKSQFGEFILDDINFDTVLGKYIGEEEGLHFIINSKGEHASPKYRSFFEDNRGEIPFIVGCFTSCSRVIWHK